MGEMANAYKILNNARVKFRESGARMSGKNDYAGYSYYELSDILPIVNKLALELGFTCIVRFTKELAELFFCTEHGSIEFTSPMSTASLKGCHEVQNLGAVETYIKRYLYQNCFEISEPDGLNATQNKPEGKKEQKPTQDIKPKTAPKMINEAQVKLLNTEISKRDIDRDAFKKFIGVESMKNVLADQMTDVLALIQKKPLKAKEQDMEQ